MTVGETHGHKGLLGIVITHYDIYRGKRAEAIAMAIEWFRAHLGRASASPAP